MLIKHGDFSCFNLHWRPTIKLKQKQVSVPGPNWFDQITWCGPDNRNDHNQPRSYSKGDSNIWGPVPRWTNLCTCSDDSAESRTSERRNDGEINNRNKCSNRFEGPVPSLTWPGSVVVGLISVLGIYMIVQKLSDVSRNITRGLPRWTSRERWRRWGSRFWMGKVSV